MIRPRLVPPAPTVAQSLTERDDDALITLAQAGSSKAFAALVARHAERVVQYCARFTGNHEQAIETAQAVWASAWERLEQYQTGTTFFLWLITIARNYCRNEWRHRRLVERHVDTVISLGVDATPEQIDALLLEEQQQRVRAALNDLPGAMREALLLRFGEELRYDEMSTVLNVDPSTLRSRVHHGLKLLKRKLESKP